MELAIAQFWSSGIGSHETTIVEFEVACFYQNFWIYCESLKFLKFSNHTIFLRLGAFIYCVVCSSLSRNLVLS
jgi:hypothetical protein